MIPAFLIPARPPRPARLALIAGTAVLGVTLTACSGGAAASDRDAGKNGDAAPSKAARASISVNLTGTSAAAGEPVTVTLAAGKLREVTVKAGEGEALGGRISADGRTWTSDRVAAPGTAYRVEARDTSGGSDTAAFTTRAADKVNKLTLAPGKNTTVGIAQPLSIVFDNPVKDKAAVEKALKVSTSNHTEGSWGWLRDYSGRDRVDWRPKEYWKSGTRITLDAELNGVDSGSGGGFFVRDYATTFTVGASQVVKVDLDRHRLALERDGRTVMDVPVSGGTPGGDKRSWRGTAVLMAKEGTINMRSETVGLGHTYDKMVDYSMRLTWSGMYAHAAPWNAAYFGRANHSSGCVGMSDANAAALYGQARVGDPFEITGAETKGTVAEGNGYGAWNVSWADWRNRSALR
ncbi:MULTISPECIES: Ig-like domain-containing protein [unclassified Streptomyces]|uniref:L,D-transpeptidase n=1 Tax=unclassified Streptomyces TaxID=2593676 RepID=UPI002ED699EF|nr:Ig-like domain-containing protein [Streptomyces sp. NBC_00891]WSY08732.1 Ig-like domain-containing protein [Streptomyces sp. NBC_00890]WSZ10355.1 Ig-like domain-containing protein [Streptomyces sp. NBC_00869]WSZ22142.1 Ig-like domain-containing protein [Streptomyces sp. NBC_00870]